MHSWAVVNKPIVLIVCFPWVSTTRGKQTVRKSITAALVLIFSIAIHAEQTSLAYAQQAAIKRTDLATTDQSTMDAGALWIADIPPGGATGIQRPGSSTSWRDR
jgi:hypothetical protein